MDWGAILDTALQALLAGGSITGITALFMVRGQKRKLLAESGRTDAEADSIVADAQAKRTAREISLIEPYERVQRRMQQEMDEAYAEIDWLKLWVRQLVALLKREGIDVPDEPPRPQPSSSVA